MGPIVEGLPLQQLDLTLRAEGLRPPDGSAAGSERALPPAVARRRFPGPGRRAEAGDGADRFVRSVQRTARSGVPISGRLALEANARLPLGSLDDLKAYTVRGTADLAGASIGGLDLGRLKGRLDLQEGVMELADLRGRLVDRPEGHGPPPRDRSAPGRRPLAPGRLPRPGPGRAGGDRKIRVDFDGVELPIGELVAAASTRDLPLSGRLTIQASAEARGRAFSDPRTWKLSGRARIPEASYQKSTLRDLSTAISLEHGRLVLADLSARLGDAPLKGRLGIDLTEPWAYEGELNTGDLPLSDLLPLLPHVPEDFPVSGTVSGRGAVRGTVRPLRIESSGQARIVHFQAGRVPVGDLPIRWTTQGETILLSAEEVQRYGGEIKGEARVPVSGDRPIEGTITLKRVDTAELSAEAPESWKLTGRADGQVRFRLRPGSGGKVPDLDADGQLSAADLTVRGIPAQVVGLTLTVREGVPRFDVQAESLGGTIHLTGDAHIGSDPKDDRDPRRAEGHRRAALQGLGCPGHDRRPDRAAGPGIRQRPVADPYRISRTSGPRPRPTWTS